MLNLKIISQKKEPTFNPTHFPSDSNRLTVYMATSEYEPLSKSGGLGEAAPGLAEELVNLGHKVRVIVPDYTGSLNVIVDEGQLPKKLESSDCDVHIGKILNRDHLQLAHPYQKEKITTRIYRVYKNYTRLRDRLALHIVGSDDYSFFGDRQFGKLYNHKDDALRFYLFGQIAASMSKQAKNGKAIFHAHEWQSAHALTLLRTRLFYKQLPTLYTIHNLKYHHNVSSDFFYRMSGLTSEAYPDLYTYKGINRINPHSNKCPSTFEKEADPTWAALNMADMINTVSKQYRNETITDSYGEGFQERLKQRSNEDNYRGIVNGVGSYWYPYFDDTDFILEKSKSKLRIQRELGLKQDPDALVIMMAARLDPQKGFHLIPEVLRRLYQDHGVNLQFVTTADRSPNQGDEIALNLYSVKNLFGMKDRIGIREPYSKELTKLIYEGADIGLIPSVFEPCGLVAPSCMINGTVPIGRAVGGMIDIIKPGKNGFLFDGGNDEEQITALLNQLLVVNDMFSKKRESWYPFVEGILKQDLSWGPPAKQYVDLYNETIAQVQRNGFYRAYGHF